MFNFFSVDTLASILKEVHYTGAVLNMMIQPTAHPKMINTDLNTAATTVRHMITMAHAAQSAVAVLVSSQRDLILLFQSLNLHRLTLDLTHYVQIYSQMNHLREKKKKTVCLNPRFNTKFTNKWFTRTASTATT